MTARLPRLFRLLLVLMTLLSSFALAQDGPPPQVRAAIRSVETMIDATDDASLRAFADERLAPAYRASFTPEKLEAHLKSLRAAVGGSIGAVSVERDPDGLRLMISGKRDATLRLVVDPSGSITKLELMEAAAPAEPEGAVGPQTTWESLPADLSQAEAAGWSGVILVRHEGKEIVRKTAGLADKASSRPTAADTVYCIGSTPIDFTVTAVMLLGERGKLTLDDPVTRFLKDVPADKRTITLRMLLTGKSGLPNFHHVESDWDADLGFIDRDTAVRRILSQTLLFKPGESEAHSHSAFVLLAAIIETIGGKSYPEFVRAEILKPLGMTRTGFYGEKLGLDRAQFAVGDGGSSVGLPNIPPNWGPTSWLVMGSGGMVSTLPDMDRYDTAIANGTLLHGPWAKWQQGGRVGVGGSDRGYFIYHATNGRGDEALFLMNGEGRSPATRAMTGALTRLVMGR